MKKRIIDTFPARHLSQPPYVQRDTLSEYSLRNGYGLGLRRRWRTRKKPIVL